MPKEILLNAFDMNGPSHQCPGLWRHPRDRSQEYVGLEYWQTLAKDLEAGLFDGIFLADVLGVYDVYGGSVASALRNGTQIPINDPFLLVPAMAAATEHLCFGITGSISNEPPYAFARKMSTLDHLTKGRVGWNIVTGYLNSAAKAAGLRQQTAHDTRYDIAEEYMEIMYKLWEGSWDDDAVVRDKERGVYIDPAKVRVIKHDGEYFRLNGIHLCEPSPQRTPVLYQAGSSERGMAFGGKHAECIFVVQPNSRALAATVKKMRQAIADVGRGPNEVVIFALITVIVAATDAEARERYDDYRSYASYEGGLTFVSGQSGIDFSSLKPDDLIKHIENDSLQSTINRYTIVDPGRTWTVRDIGEHVAFGGHSPVIVGSPKTVADELQRIVEEAGIDGFNLNYTVTPEGMKDFIRLVVPELQNRGAYKTAYSPGTYREKLFHRGSRLAAGHPAGAHRPA